MGIMGIILMRLLRLKRMGLIRKILSHVLFTGEIIERYPERDRVLVYGEMSNKLPLHVVCDYSDEDMIYITTVYIPSSDEWSHNFQRRKRR